jgi:hypothetical protein
MNTVVFTPVHKIPLSPFAKGRKTRLFPLYQRGIEVDFHGKTGGSEPLQDRHFLISNWKKIINIPPFEVNAAASQLKGPVLRVQEDRA